MTKENPKGWFMRIYIIVLLVMSLLISSCAVSFDKKKMDSFFTRIEEHEQGMGNVSIFADEKEVYNRSFGYADVKGQRRINANTQFRIGSITKTFTAVMILQLIEEGKISLDTTLDSFFSEVQNAEKITIRHLLKHQSGIYNITDKTYPLWMEQPHTRAEILEKIVANDLDFVPGESENYSNSAYILLSLIIEQIENTDYAEILQRRIVHPLKLKNTQYGGNINPQLNEVLPYVRLTEWKQTLMADMSTLLGSGAIISTSHDINVFYNSLFSGKLISEGTLNEMLSIDYNMGMGIFPMPFYERTGYGHGGGIDGFQSIVLYFPEERISVAYTTNEVVLPQNDILIGVLSIFFGMDYDLPVFSDGSEVDIQILQDYAGKYESEALLIDMTIFLADGKFMAQATEQSVFLLTAVDVWNFTFDTAGIKIQFIGGEDKFILHQAGMEFEFTKIKEVYDE